MKRTKFGKKIKMNICSVGEKKKKKLFPPFSHLPFLPFPYSFHPSYSFLSFFFFLVSVSLTSFFFFFSYVTPNPPLPLSCPSYSLTFPLFHFLPIPSPSCILARFSSLSYLSAPSLFSVSHFLSSLFISVTTLCSVFLSLAFSFPPPSVSTCHPHPLSATMSSLGWPRSNTQPSSRVHRSDQPV